MHTSVKMASRPIDSICSIISDVPGNSYSSGLSNELNETSDTLVLISKEGNSLVWTYWTYSRYEANSS